MTKRVLNAIDVTGKQKLKVGVIALDILKAFDCVEWPTVLVKRTVNLRLTY